MPISSYDALTRWASSAGVGPVIRGRRSDSGAPLIHFLSGNGFCGGVYWPMLQRLMPQYDVLTHDIEGQGESDNPAQFSGLPALIRRVPQVMDDLGLQGQPLIGIGHSFGGALTLRVAADHPERFKALVLLDPIVMPPAFFLGTRFASLIGRHPLARASRRRRDTWPTRDALADHLRGRGTYKGWTEAAFQSFVDYASHDQDGQRVLSCPRELEADIFEHPIYPWPSFRRLRVPTLLVRGRDSFSFFPRAERLARRLNPQIQFKTLPGGHCFMQEDPAATSAVIAEFLAGI